MTRHRRCGIAVALALVLGCHGSPKPPPRETRIRLGERTVPVIGNHAISLDRIQRAIDENPSWIEAAVYGLYLDEGYAAAKIVLRPESLAISEGPRYRVRVYRTLERDPSGGEIPPLEGRVWNLLRVHAGDWFSRRELVADVRAIEHWYRDSGYAVVQVDVKSGLDAGRAAIDLVLAVQRGPLVTIDSITVVGASAPGEARVRSVLSIAAGQRFRETALEQTRAAILATGLFEQVVFATKMVGGDRIEVSVEVRERKP